MRLLTFVIALAVLGAIAAPAPAQHNHAAGHNHYQRWASEAVANCCNNDDCGTLEEDELRETPAGGIEVKIDGEWCPVLRKHFIIRGRSPDWSVAHACVGKSEHWKMQPRCERLLCFSHKGGF